MTIKQAVQYCIEDSKFDYANWLLTKIFTHKQCVQYAVFAAEQVLHIFEAKNPDDNRPRLAIQAAKDWLIDPSQKNVDTARHAASCAANAASYATDYAADAASYAADAARNAYYTASYAADCAARYAVDAATNVDNAASMHTAIFNYGLKLLGQ
jgi:hypothetical protein